jgi:hypothetical protein
MVPVTDAVDVPFVATHVRDGVVETDDPGTAGGTSMPDELLMLGAPLSPLRRPAVAQRLD